MLFCGNIAAQTTAVNAKGSKVAIDTSKWQLSGSNITAKNTGNVGVGVAAPLYKLDIATATNPLRLKGLQSPAVNAGGQAGSLVADTGGVVKLQNRDNISAVRLTGSCPLTTGGVGAFVAINAAGSSITKTFDNLNEFSGNTFTAKRAGLYMVVFLSEFNERPDDAYLGYNYINISGTTISRAGISIPAPEGGSNSELCVSNTTIYKLNAGETFTFYQLAFYSSVSAGSPVFTTFHIDIVRLD